MDRGSWMNGEQYNINMDVTFGLNVCLNEPCIRIF